MIRGDHPAFGGFLVIEPVNPQYRVLKTLKDHPDPAVRELARSLRIYTAGNDQLSPLYVAPLEVNDGVARDEHVETVLGILKASMPLPGPILGILAEALERLYDDVALRPVLANLFVAADEVRAEKRYSGDLNSDIRAAIEVRKGDLTRRIMGRIFQFPASIPPVSELMRSFTVIEMNRLTREQACLLSLCVLLTVYEYVRVNHRANEGLRFVIILEEAHAIVGSNAEAAPSEHFADPRAYASELICKLLVELRAMGVGIVIADQHPSAVARQVVRTTSSSLIFRATATDDCEDAAASAVMAGQQMAEMPRLVPGEAFFYREGFRVARRIRTTDLHSKLGLAVPPSDGELLSIIEGEEWHLQSKEAESHARLAEFKHGMDAFDHRRLAILREWVHAEQRRLDAVPGAPSGALGGGRESTHRGRSSKLQARLRQDYERSVKRMYQALVQTPIPARSGDIELFRSTLVDRFEHVVRPDTEALLERLGLRASAELKDNANLETTNGT